MGLSKALPPGRSAGASCLVDCDGLDMDLNTITEIARPRSRADFAAFNEGDAWLAGGTWLFSEPQPRLKRLVDLSTCDWAPLSEDDAGLFVAATCTVATLDAFEPPVEWVGAQLIGQCCRAFLASFKIWNMATVGGNLCMALPAGPMISLCAALDGVCLIWTPQGNERRVSLVDFVLGPQQNALRAGELLRGIELPRHALMRRTAFRRATLTPLGRSGVLLIGALTTDGGFILNVTASTRRPVRLEFDEVPQGDVLARRLASDIPANLYYDDVHGRPDWRCYMTFELAEEIRCELGGARR
jgi:CO/xanthine dehydrogenase FAD-binding subunit